MKIAERILDACDAQNARGGVVAIGTFDGVHIGHQALISRAVSLAQGAKVPCALFTFQNHPLSVLAPEHVPPALSSREERRRVFALLGVDVLIEERFTEALAALSAEEFLSRLADVLAPCTVVVGENFSFGAGGRGTPDFLAARGQALGFRVEKVPLLSHAGETVSSTRIRALLSTGDVRLAGELLGRPFEIEGVVAHGDERGRKLGFPTANLLPRKGGACPAIGVYAACVLRKNGETHPGIANVGDNPTFDGVELRVETHLLDFSGDLYGERIAVRFVERLRGEIRFPSADALVRQIREDERRARELFRVLDGAG
jgi:riboflavin kinase/FMN adenylyltransferase